MLKLKVDECSENRLWFRRSLVGVFYFLVILDIIEIQMLVEGICGV